MTDAEHTKAVVEAVYAAGNAISAARRGGLTVDVILLNDNVVPLSVRVERTTPLYDVGKRVDVTNPD